MRPDDGGSTRPPLPAEAGPNERTLYEVYDFQTGIVDLTASDWATSAESVRGLSADVRGIVSALRGAPDAWSGPAAEAAYQTLGKLADNLDGHAEEIDRIEAGLTGAMDSATAARTDYVTKVRSVSLDIDPADFQHTPFTQPTQVSADLPTVLDRPAYDSAVAGARAAREQQAAAVLATFTDSMTTATKKLPVEPSDPASVPGGTGPSGGSSGPPTGGGSTPSGSSHLPPGGTGDPGPGGWTPTDVTGGDDLPWDDTGDDDPDDTDTGGGGGNPWPPLADPPPPVLDGPVDGTTSPGGGGGSVGPLPGSTGPGGSAGQLGPGGAAAGMGGMLAGGGAAAVLGRAGMPGGAPAARLPGGAPAGRAAGSVVSTSSGGVAGRTGAASAGAGRSSVIAGGGQGGTARGGAAGRGSGVRTGRYGVPKLGGGAGGRGAVGASGAAGSRGGTTEREDAPEVDHLTREDEETWFEGAEDATPPVWE
jgi:hypothetical protein